MRTSTNLETHAKCPFTWTSERQWINEIKNIIKEEVKVDIEVAVSIFCVPATLSAIKPEAYMPQLIGLGPYHHFRPELYEMERCKLVAASQLQKQFQSLEFDQLVDKLIEFEYKIRASYHKFLDFDRDTLLWIMAIDGLFLLEFLGMYVNKDDTSNTNHLVDSAGRKLSQDVIVSDIMMLENQIPFILLSKILSIQCSSTNLDDNLLPSMLMTFCKAISPLKLMEDFPLHQVVNYAHLLDLLYHLIVPKLEEGHESTTKDVQTSATKPNATQHVASGISYLASNYKKIIKPENPISSETQNHPQVEKIMIPSVSYLYNVAGVELCPTTNITMIRFVEEEKKFYLPAITLNVYSEVIMRNLVAYEASTVSGSLIFTGYTELLNGILETDEDAKLLRQKKIIVNSLKSDAEVLQLFNGISKSIRLTHVPYVDKAIKDVNNFFYNSRKVQAYKWIKKYFLLCNLQQI
ncbi:hypothetical protein HYC85_010319 [Camellia sinensis]|uniref:Uncharacterized protein n=1 Tax=Camellia sinensis TaxID=4442 RepID=A0A7J7HII2_CAMSI|nr:hypothetical protein HYC85_010319 [Camellia sinensis]